MTALNVMFCFWLGYIAGGVVTHLPRNQQYIACLVLGASTAIIGYLMEAS